MIEEIWSQFIGFTQQFVVPDWGSLVNLIPILIAILAFLFLTWTIYRFATAGPTRRGKRRITPVPPPGTHLPGGSFAPLLGAFGVLMLGFGLVSGGLWLLIGGVVLGITLLYWGREFQREYDHLPSASTALVTTGGQALSPGSVAPPPGALPTPQGTPPAGVHIPAPSFRPLLIAMSMTLLVAGLIFGGWALILGAVALSVTLIGWLIDAVREYRAAVAADRTGHLDAGPSPTWPVATFAALAWFLAGGLLLTSGILPNSAAPEPGAALASAVAGGGVARPSAAAPSLPTADALETAENTAFVVTALEAPAGKPFTIAFDNKDAGQPHNIAIHDASGTALFTGKIVTGPTVVVYDVPALPAGTYPFVCSVHANMTGTLTTK